MHNLDSPKIDSSQIVNVAPEEAQIPVYHINEPDCEALGFTKSFWGGKFHVFFKRDERLMCWNILIFD